MTESPKQIDEWLDTINRTRLIFLSTEAMGEFIDFASMRDGKNRPSAIKSEFIKRATFHEIESEQKKLYGDGFSLSEFLEDYKAASAFYTRRIKDSTYFNFEKNETVIFNLLRFTIGDHTLSDDVPERATEIFLEIYDPERDAYQYDVALLLLLIIKAFPVYEKGRSGDLTRNDMMGLYKKAYDTLEAFFSYRECGSPALEIHKKRLQIDKEYVKDASRLALFVSVNNILNAHTEFMNEDLRCQKAKKQKDTCILYDIFDDFWIMPDYRPQGNIILWRFLFAGEWSAFAVQYVCSPSERGYGFSKVEITQYEFCFEYVEGRIMATLAHPDFIRSIVAGKKNDSDSRALYEVDLDFPSEESRQPQKMSFSLMSKDKYGLNMKALERLESEKGDKYQKQIKDCANTHKDYYVLWRYVKSISEHEIVIQDAEDGEMSEEGYVPPVLKDRYFHIPVHEDDDVFSDVSMADVFGVINLDGRKHILHSISQRCYDVTTAEDRAACGIILTDADGNKLDE